jgi:hypothetical protein
MLALGLRACECVRSPGDNGMRQLGAVAVEVEDGLEKDV